MDIVEGSIDPNDFNREFKNSENTEGVSDANNESGVLHDVGESHASEQTDNDSLASGELPLEKITEAKEVCNCTLYCNKLKLGFADVNGLTKICAIQAD